MMMPKQKPEKPAPPMAPSCDALKPYSPPQLSRMPPRMAKPTPAAKMAANPAQSSRLAFGTMPESIPLLIYCVFLGLGESRRWMHQGGADRQQNLAGKITGR